MGPPEEREVAALPSAATLEIKDHSERATYTKTARPDQGLPLIVGRLPKNRNTDLRIALEQFKGFNLLDLRLFTPAADGEPERATKSGVSLRVEMIRELIESLQRAEAEPTRIGWL